MNTEQRWGKPRVKDVKNRIAELGLTTKKEIAKNFDKLSMSNEREAIWFYHNFIKE